MKPKMIHIAVLEDEILFRKSIIFLLKHESNFKIIFDGNNGQEFVDYLKESLNTVPDVVLLDLRMPKMDGMELTKFLNKKFPNVKIIALTTYNSNVFAETMIENGAVGFLSKSALPEDVVATINNVIAQGFYFQPDVLQVLLKQNHVPEHSSDEVYELTKREMEVLQLMYRQYSTKEIADQLCLSERTVEGHRKNILYKTHSKNSIGLIFWGIRNKILSVDEFFK